VELDKNPKSMRTRDRLREIDRTLLAGYGKEVCRNRIVIFKIYRRW
jgi:hypothetical protein